MHDTSADPSELWDFTAIPRLISRVEPKAALLEPVSAAISTGLRSPVAPARRKRRQLA